jgi:putative NADH-flavin reductase
MRIIIFGANGRTGKEIMIQALIKGTDVTAFVRRPESIDLKDDRLTVVLGDVRDATAVDKAVMGMDAVLVALGNRSTKEKDLMAVATQNIIAAMNKHGIKRIIVESSAGLFGAKDSGFFFGYIIRPLFLKTLFDDKVVQLSLLEKSDLDWVLVRPSGLIDAQKTGKYNITFDKPSGRKISRSDVAEFMLAQVTGNKYLKQLPIISY